MNPIQQSTIEVNCPQFGMLNLELLSCVNQEAKNKSPLLFIHGSFHAAWCWAEHFMPYFANQGFSVYALSFRGHGSSDGQQAINEYTLEHFVDDVSAAVATFDKPPILIGHSFGGVVIQQYLQQANNPCEHIILLASPKPRGASRSAVLRALRHPISYAKLMKFNKGQDDIPAALFFSNDLTNDVKQSYVKRFQRQSQRVFEEFKLFYIKQVPARLSSCLVVVAEKGDTFISLRDAKKTARFYSGILKTVTASAHDMMLEKDWQQTADVMLAWLKKK